MTETHYGIGHVGDLWVTDHPPERLALAIEIIGLYLHQAYAAERRIGEGLSQKSCILMAATVRDFLYRVGFRDAQVRPVVFFIEAIRNDEVIKQLGIGNPEGPQKREDAFDGHMIVTAEGWLIDPTLFHATPREQWPTFPTMMAQPLFKGDPAIEWFGLPVLTGGAVPENDQGNLVRWAWLDQPINTDYLTSGDWRKKFKRERVTDLMVRIFRAKEKAEPIPAN